MARKASPVTDAAASPSRPPTSTGSKDWATTPFTRSEARGGVVGEGRGVGAGVAVGAGATGVRCERALRSFEMSMTSGSSVGSAVGSSLIASGVGSTAWNGGGGTGVAGAGGDAAVNGRGAGGGGAGSGGA